MVITQDTLTDAYRYTLALVTADSSEAMRIQGEYGDDKLRDLFAAVSGVSLGIFANVSSELRKKLEGSLRFGITGDESYIQAAKADDPVPGQYL